tara:strand:- start:480 stop:806 length:327 start_codon:yes stop_codon:yes gene_type:complete
VSNLTRLKPVNRHILVVPHPDKTEGDKSAVLLPEGYAPKTDKYGLATVVDISSDCAKHFQNLKLTRTSEPTVIVVDRSMLEEVEVNGGKHHLVLENYVVGIIRGIDEN